MMTMSRVAPKNHGLMFGAEGPAGDHEPQDGARVAHDLVKALEQGGMAAMVIDAASFATIAENCRFRQLVGSASAERELKGALRSTGGGASGLIWCNDQGVAHVARRYSLACGGGMTTLVTLSDPHEDHALRLADFVRRYDITPAEERLLSLLLCGEGLAGSADALGVSMATVKSHMGSLLAKTGTARQAALVAFFYRGAGNTITCRDRM